MEPAVHMPGAIILLRHQGSAAFRPFVDVHFDCPLFQRETHPFSPVADINEYRSVFKMSFKRKRTVLDLGDAESVVRAQIYKIYKRSGCSGVLPYYPEGIPATGSNDKRYRKEDYLFHEEECRIKTQYIPVKGTLQRISGFLFENQR